MGLLVALSILNVVGAGTFGTLVALSTGPTVAQTPETSALLGEWKTYAVDNPLTDATTIIAELKSSSGTTPLGQPIPIIVQCSGGNLTFDVLFGHYLGDDSLGGLGLKTVWVRFGSETAQELQFNIAPDLTSVTEQYKVHDLITKFRGEAGLVVATQPYSSRMLTVEFDTTGARQALRPLLDACPPPKAYSTPVPSQITYQGNTGIIRVLKTGATFEFSRASTPGAEMLYGECRLSLGTTCNLGLTVEDGNLVAVWSAFPDRTQ